MKRYLVPNYTINMSSIRTVCMDLRMTWITHVNDGTLLRNATLAAWRESQGASAAGSLPADPDAIRPRRHDLPSSVQRNLAPTLAAGVSAEASAFYEVRIALNFAPALDFDQLEAAFRRTVARHPELASVFRRAAGGEWAVTRLNAECFVLGRHDCRAATSDAAAARLQSLIRRGFDIAAGPLVTLDVLLLADGSSTLLLRACQLVADATTMEIMLAWLVQAYFGFEESRPASEGDYEDFVDAEEEFAESPEAAAHLAYWRQQFGSCAPARPYPPEALPPPCPSGPPRRDCELSPALTAAIRAAARREGVSLFTWLLAAYARALAPLAGGPTMVIRSTAQNRMHRAFRGTAGAFAMFGCMRLAWPAESGFPATLAAVRVAVDAALAHQNSPWWALEQLFPTPAAGRSELDQFQFQKRFAQQEGQNPIARLLHEPDEPPIEVEGLRMSAVPLEDPTSLRDITTRYYEAEDRILVESIFRPAAIAGSAVTALLARFVAEAEAAASR